MPYMTSKQRRQLATLNALLAARRAVRTVHPHLPERTPERTRRMYMRLTEAGLFVTPKPGTWAWRFKTACLPAELETTTTQEEAMA